MSVTARSRCERGSTPLDAARAAYDAYLKMPREPGHVLMIRQGARVLRSGAVIGQPRAVSIPRTGANTDQRASLSHGGASLRAPSRWGSTSVLDGQTINVVELEIVAGGFCLILVETTEAGAI